MFRQIREKNAVHSKQRGKENLHVTDGWRSALNQHDEMIVWAKSGELLLG
jgi:hypothetical protein